MCQYHLDGADSQSVKFCLLISFELPFKVGAVDLNIFTEENFVWK